MRLRQLWTESMKPWVAVVDAGPLGPTTRCRRRSDRRAASPVFRTADLACCGLFGIWARAVHRLEH